MKKHFARKNKMDFSESLKLAALGCLESSFLPMGLCLKPILGKRDQDIFSSRPLHSRNRR